MQLIRSLIFIFLMYFYMLILGIIFLIPTLLNKEVAHKAVKVYTSWVRKTAAVVVGLKSEVRGEIPTDEVLICSKHQSFFDIILIVDTVPRPKFIMKKQLVRAPILGYYALAIGCVPVDRGKRGAAVKQMIADVAAGRARAGQLIIFPQGTRVAAGAKLPYKVGAAVLYTESGQAAVPAATNVGVFWKKHGLTRYPGNAVVEFLPRIEPGLEIHEFTAKIEEVVESNSNRLMREAGFDPDSYVED